MAQRNDALFPMAAAADLTPTRFGAAQYAKSAQGCPALAPPWVRVALEQQWVLTAGQLVAATAMGWRVVREGGCWAAGDDRLLLQV